MPAVTSKCVTGAQEEEEEEEEEELQVMEGPPCDATRSVFSRAFGTRPGMPRCGEAVQMLYTARLSTWTRLVRLA
jgi:hypothetical protein